MNRQPAAVEKVGEALTDVIAAGQRLLIDRVDLAVLEGRESLERAAISVALIVLGVLLLVGALIAADLALMDRLRESVSRPSLLLGCALLHAALGGSLLSVGLRRRVTS